MWIGVNMDEAGIRSMLDACLLTDEEMALGPEGWAQQLEDPLPPWLFGEDGDEELFEDEEDDEEVV